MDLGGIDRKKFLIHLIIVVVFVIYLVSADVLFNTVIPVSDESKRISLPIPDASGDIRYGFGPLQVLNLEWKTVISINGWAFLPHQNTSSTRKFVVLLSEASPYVYEASTVPRPDVLTIFGLDSLDTGFYTNIPVSNIHDGHYQIGLILVNETGPIFSITDVVFTKMGNRVIPYVFSETTEMPMITNTGDIQYYIYEVRRKLIGGTDILSITGWAFIPGGRSAGTKTYVVLASDNATYMFSSVLIPRSDVADYFGNRAYFYSGFCADIPIYSLRNETYTMGIFLDNGDMRYRCDTNTTVRIPGGEWSGAPVPS